MGQAVAKQGPNTIGNTSVSNGQLFQGNFNNLTINSAAAARTDFTGDFTPTSLKPVQTYVQRSHLLKQLKAQLHTCIENGETDPKCVVVHGLGGAGKSQLVLDYIRQYRRDYSATIWISAGSRASIERDFTQLYRVLYSAVTQKGTELPTIEDIVLMVKSWFSEKDGRWLFVLDSADEIGSEEGHTWDIGKYMFDLPAMHTIITTRSSVAKDMSTNMPVKVGEMEESEATELFKKCAKLKDDKQTSEVELIVKELGCLALAVTLAGFYISQTPELALDLRDYLPLYRRQRKVLLQQRPWKVLHQYGESVLTAWETSFRSVENRSPASAHFLPLLACISPDDIYTGLFCDLKDADDPDSLWKRLLGLKEPVDLYTVQDCLRNLAEYSLVQWQDDQESYVMHRVVHAWAFERLQPQEQQKYTHAMVELLSRWASLSELSLAKKDRIVPHITANHKTVNSALRSINESSDDAISGMLTLYFRTTNFLYKMGKYSQASAGFRACSVSFKALYGPEHPDTILAMNNLASTLRDQGKTDEAASMQQQVLEMIQRILGPEHPDTILAMSNLASMLSDQGKTDEAASIKQQVLEMIQRILGPEHPHTIVAMNNLASTLRDQGKTDNAASIQQQVLEMIQRILGPEHPHTIVAMNNLAISLTYSGKFDEAVLMQQQVLEKMQKVLGPEHPNTTAAMKNLDIMRNMQQRTSE